MFSCKLAPLRFCLLCSKPTSCIKIHSLSPFELKFLCKPNQPQRS
nr:MAG TPA: hypothetical protein [Caudoviricetes sp.]